MSTEHHTHDDQRLEPNKTGEQADEPGIQVVSTDERDPAASAAHDRRWQDVLANFVFDPRGAVLAATELVVNDVSAFVAVLDERRNSMLNAPSEDHTAATEDLRQAAATYRDISKQLVASTQALMVSHRGGSHRGELAREDLEAEQPEVIGWRVDASGRRQAVPHRGGSPAQTPPGKPSSQDQRR